MKKFITALLAAVMALSLIGCDKSGDTRTKDDEMSGSSSEKSSSESESTDIDTSGSDSSVEPSESSQPDESSLPENGSMGSVTILGEEYDVATTTELDLSFKELTDERLAEIAPKIERLVNLSGLGLDHNRITDISPLKGLNNLTILNLSDNELTDISQLTSLTGLRDLSLYDSSLTEEDIAQLKQQLPDCGIFF